jgi:hypothetical protein
MGRACLTCQRGGEQDAGSVLRVRLGQLQARLQLQQSSDINRRKEGGARCPSGKIDERADSG